MVPAALAGRDLDAVRREAVGDDEEPCGVPVEGARLVVDERGKPRGPRAPRSLEVQLRATQRVGIRRNQGPEVAQLAAGLRQREHLLPRTAATPAPSSAEPAGVGDGRVERFAHAGRAGSATSGGSGVAVSAIGTTVASARIRSVPGGTANTVVSSPAAAHTSGYRPRSGSMTTRIGRSNPIGGMPPIE